MTKTTKTRGAIRTAGGAALVLVLVLAGCAGPRTPPPEAAPAVAPDAAAQTLAAYERRWRREAETAARQGRLDDAVWAWDVVAALRPEDPTVGRRRAQLEAQIKAAVAERWPRAQQALARGDAEGAARLYLEILALSPDHAAAADALRAIERQRAPRAMASLRPRPAVPASGGRNEVEHASLLAGDGEVEAAITLLQPVALRRNADPAARSLLADLYVRRAERLPPAQHAAAVAALERAVKLQPGHVQAQRRLREMRGISAPAGASSPAR